MKISCTEWGTLEDGRRVQLYTMTNAHNHSVSITTFGGIITSIIMPDVNGDLGNVVLGYDTLEEYVADDGYLGAMVGRYANRIEGAEFSINGVAWKLTKNQGDNTLHGGTGFHKKLWTAIPSDKGLVLRYLSPDGEDGFPGNLEATICCSLSDDDCFTMDMQAVSDQDTVCCLTNHSYFNLAESGDIFSHFFQICAEEYTPFKPNMIPDGSIQPVAGTEYDFREERLLINKNFDVNYVLSKKNPHCAIVRHPESGRILVVDSDMPAMQFYAGGGLTVRNGRYGRIYGSNSGFCLEPQLFPNSPNMPEFPTCILKKDELYHHVIQYKFRTRREDK